MKNVKKKLKKLIIPSIVLALGLFTFIGAKAGIFDGKVPKGANGGPAAESRGTADNPFVILEVAPTLSGDSFSVNNSTKTSTATLDPMQAMRWGVGSAVSSLLTNQSLLHDTTTCENLAAYGVVTLGHKVTGKVYTESEYNSLSSEMKKFCKEENSTVTTYTYLRPATNADTGTKLVMVVDNVEYYEESFLWFWKTTGYRGFEASNNGEYKLFKNGSNNQMVYVGSGGDYDIEYHTDIKKIIHFYNINNAESQYASLNPACFVYETSTTAPSGTGFSGMSPEAGFSQYYVQFNSQTTGTGKYATTTYAAYYAMEMTYYDYILLEKKTSYGKRYTESDHYDSLTSTNLFITDVLHADPATSHVEVVSITAANLKSNQALIDRADFIVINSTSSGTDFGGYGATGRDFDAATMLKLYSKASEWNLSAGTNGCPVVMNNSILTCVPGDRSADSNTQGAWARYYKVNSNGTRLSYFASSIGYSNCVYRLAVMLHTLDDEQMVSIYLNNQSGTPRINRTDGKYVLAKVKGTEETLRWNSNSILPTNWNQNVLAPFHLSAKTTVNDAKSDIKTRYGWREDNTKTVLEDEYWMFATTESNLVKYYFMQNNNYKTGYSEYYVTEHIYEYFNPSLKTSQYKNYSYSPLQIMDFLLNKGFRFEPTPSATPTETPTPFEFTFEVKSGGAGRVQVDDSPWGTTSSITKTFGWNDLKEFTVFCKAQADSNSHFYGWYTDENFATSPIYTITNLNLTIEAVAGKTTIYARFVTNTPTCSPTPTNSPTPTPRVSQGLRVLEVQAYASFESAANWNTMIGKIYGVNGLSYSVVDTVTIKEFISRVEDLETEYDLIYFGLKTNSYYTSWVSGVSKNTWNYYISHTGPLFFYGKNSRVGGLSRADVDVNVSENQLRTYLSGNDITNKKYRELEKFLASDGVIVFASDFYSNGSINTKRVDTNSELYKLLNNYKNNKNVLVYGNQNSTTQKNFRDIRESKFVTMDMTVQPVEYNEKASDENRYINGKLDTERVLRFKFTIKDNHTITNPYEYELGLYVDLNSDGRFNSSATENLKGATIIDKTTNKQVEEGQKLLSWHVYEVTRDVSELVGVIPWKLELTRVNSDVTTSETGFSAIKARADERVRIRVLQIHENGGSDSEGLDGYDNHITYLLPTTDDLKNYLTRQKVSWSSTEDLYKKAYNLLSSADISNDDDSRNLSPDDIVMKDSRGYSFSLVNAHKKNAAKTTQQYFLLFQNLNEFTVEIDRMSCKVFNEWAKTHSLIDSYDMVILGFSDGYSDLENKAGEALNDFINTGRSVLFAHDTTSFSNISVSKNNLTNGRWRNDWYWGVNINSMFRARLGMDRYNVKGKNPTSYSSDPDYVQDAVRTTDAHKFSNNDYNRGVYNQGYNDIEIASSSRPDSNYVEQVNKGAITIYPYAVGDIHNPDKKIKVSLTHCQYYQLDMENPNIVVWYTLASDSSSNAFTLDPKDGQNSYYIYNIGNITYTGAGHSVDNPTTVLDELKLFVNTVISAYRAAGSPVDTYITNDEKTSGDNIDYLYIDFDSNNTTMAVGEGIKDENGKQSKKVTFTVEDNSIIDTQRIEVNYYIQKSDVDLINVTDLDNPAYWNAINFETYNVSGSNKEFVSVNNEILTSGGINYYRVYDRKEYGFWLPLELIEKSSSMTIRIQTTITYGSTEDGNLSKITTDKYVEVLRRGFFNLD